MAHALPPLTSQTHTQTSCLPILWGNWGIREVTRFIEDPKKALTEDSEHTYIFITEALQTEAIPMELLLKVASCSAPLFDPHNCRLPGWNKGTLLLENLVTGWGNVPDALCAELIRSGATVNETILKIFCEKDVKESLDALLERQVLPKIFHQKLLNHFALHGNGEKLNALIQKLGPTFIEVPQGQDTILISLCKGSHMELALEYIDRFPELVPHKGIGGNTIVHWAAHKQLDPLLCKLLVLYPICRSWGNAKGHTPLHTYLLNPTSKRTLSAETAALLVLGPGDHKTSIDEQLFQLIAASSPAEVKKFYNAYCDQMGELTDQLAAFQAGWYGGDTLARFFLKRMHQGKGEALLKHKQPLSFLLRSSAMWGMSSTILHLLQQKASSPICTELLARPESKSQSAKDLAALFFRTDILQLLHENGATFAPPDSQGNTLFHPLESPLFANTPQPQDWKQAATRLWENNLELNWENHLFLLIEESLKSFKVPDIEIKRTHWDKIFQLVAIERHEAWLDQKNQAGRRPIDVALKKGEIPYAIWLLEKMTQREPVSHEEWCEWISYALSLQQGPLLQRLLSIPHFPKEYSGVVCLYVSNRTYQDPLFPELFQQLIEGGMLFHPKQPTNGKEIKAQNWQSAQSLSHGDPHLLHYILPVLPKTARDMLFLKILKGPKNQILQFPGSLGYIRDMAGADSESYRIALRLASKEEKDPDPITGWDLKERVTVAAKWVHSPDPETALPLTQEQILSVASSVPSFADSVIQKIESKEERRKWARLFFEHNSMKACNFAFLLHPDLADIASDKTLVLISGEEPYNEARFSLSSSLIGQQSHLLSNLFSSRFSESTQSEIRVTFDTDIEIFKLVLEFLYGKSIEITHDNVEPLIEISTYFGIDSLTRQIKKWIKQRPERHDLLKSLSLPSKKRTSSTGAYRL